MQFKSFHSIMVYELTHMCFLGAFLLLFYFWLVSISQTSGMSLQEVIAYENLGHIGSKLFLISI